MNTRSKVIRILLFPAFLPLWLIGLVVLIINIIFEHLWDIVDRLRDKFESWVNDIAPLD